MNRKPPSNIRPQGIDVGNIRASAENSFDRTAMQIVILFLERVDLLSEEERRECLHILKFINKPYMAAQQSVDIFKLEELRESIVNLRDGAEKVGRAHLADSLGDIEAKATAIINTALAKSATA